MDEKELKKMNRADLLEILYEQQLRIEALEKENKELLSQLDAKKIALKDTGSIAEASLALTNVFAEAQKAADLYLANIINLYRKAGKGDFIEGLKVPSASSDGRHSGKSS